MRAYPQWVGGLFIQVRWGLAAAGLAAFAIFLGSCAGSPAERTVTVMTTDSFAISEAVVQRFEAEYQVKVVFLKSGDAGEALNKAVLTKNAPLADVLFGVDNTLLSRALSEGIFESYAPAGLEKIPEAYRMDPENRATPVDHGAVCLNFDPQWFSAHALVVPASLEDLAKPEYRGLLAVENPATSSPGLAFLLATVAHFGEDGYLEYWRALRENEVTIVDGWNTAYYTNFSGSSGKGAQPLVVSYATSPVAEMIYADPPLNSPPTGVILAPDTCFLQVEFAGILAGTKNRGLAERVIDFLVSVPYQEDIPLQNLMYPVRPEAKLPDSFLAFGQAPERAATLSPEEIARNRDRWIREWTAAILKLG